MDLEKTCWKLHGRVEKEEVFNESGKGAQKKGRVSDALKDQMIRKNLIIKEYKKEKEDTLKTKVRMQECAILFGGKYTELLGASQVVLVEKNTLPNAGVLRDSGLIPESGRSPGGGHDNPLQYSCLENLMVRGAWWATVYKVTKNQSRLK